MKNRTSLMARIVAPLLVAAPSVAFAHPGHGADAHVHGEFALVGLAMALAVGAWLYVRRDA